MQLFENTYVYCTHSIPLGQENQGAENKGGPAHLHDPLAPASQPGRGTGATGLLDSDDEADGRQARLHLWPHLQDACILAVQCML